MASEVDLPPQSDEEAVAWQDGYDLRLSEPKRREE